MIMSFAPIGGGGGGGVRMESSEIVLEGAMHEFNISQHGQGGCVIVGHTQMNKQRQYKQLVHEARETAGPSHLY